MKNWLEERIRKETQDRLSHLRSGCVVGGVSARCHAPILVDSEGPGFEIQITIGKKPTMILNKSTALTLAGLVFCGANTVSAALVPPALKSPAKGTLNVPPKAITLDWAAARSAGGYEYTVRDSNGKVVKEGTLPASKTAVRVNLDYEQSYKWKVRSIKLNSAPSKWSSTWSFSTALHPRPGLTEPADGQSGVGSVQSDGTVRVVLEWTGLNGAKQYELQVGTDSSFSGAKTRTVDGTSTELILDRDVAVYWRIRSLAAADKAYWSAHRSFTPVSVRSSPEIVSPISNQVIGGDSIPLAWLGGAGTKSYIWTLCEGKIVGGNRRIQGSMTGLKDTIRWSGCKNSPSIGYLTLEIEGGGRNSAPMTFVFKGVPPQMSEGKWGNYSRYYLKWSEVCGNRGYEVTIYNLDGNVRFTRQVSQNNEALSIHYSELPKEGFKYSVKATGYDGISSDSSAILTEGPWGK